MVPGLLTLNHPRLRVQWLIFQKAKADETLGEELPKALKPLGKEDLKKALSSFGGTSLTILKDGIENLPPLRAKEVQEVQSLIVNMVKEMEELGEIVIVSGDEEMI